MKKFLSMFIAAAVSLSILNISASADVLLFDAGVSDSGDFSVNVTRDAEKSEIDINVVLKEAKAHVLASVVVKTADAKINYIKQGYTDILGKKTFQYINKGAEGTYSVTVEIPSLNESKSLEFSYLSSDSLNKILETIKAQRASASPDISILKKVFEENAAGLGIDMTAYNKLSDKDNVYSLLVKDTEDISDISGINEAINLFYDAVILEKINENGSGEDITSFLADTVYASFIEFDSQMPKSVSNTKKNVYDEITDQAKTVALADAASLRPYSSLKALKSNIVMKTLCCGLQYASNYKNALPLLKAYKAAGLLNVDFTAYNDLLNQTPVMQKMVGSSFADYSAVKKKFDSLVSDEAASETKKNSSSSGGGGGSSGSGGSGSSSSGGYTYVPTSSSSPSPSPSASTAEASTEDDYLPFDDMDNAKWAIRAVIYDYKKGIIGGTGDSKFEPTRTITRAEFSRMLLGLITDTSSSAAENPFTDVSSSDWYYDYVMKAYKSGIVSGNGEGIFAPNASVTREEMAVMASRVYKQIKDSVSDKPGSDLFTDESSCAEWAVSSVRILQNAGIVKGDLNGRFNPKNELTRAEAAQIIYNILKK